MRLTDEQVMQDNKRFANCNALAELKYCGWDIPHRKSITNDEIRFYAWLCRSAVALLKEQEPVAPEKQNGYLEEWPSFASWWYVCGSCGRKIDYHDRFCRWCGRYIKWE